MHNSSVPFLAYSIQRMKPTHTTQFCEYMMSCGLKENEAHLSGEHGAVANVLAAAHIQRKERKKMIGSMAIHSNGRIHTCRGSTERSRTSLLRSSAMPCASSTAGSVASTSSLPRTTWSSARTHVTLSRILTLARNQNLEPLRNYA